MEQKEEVQPQPYLDAFGRIKSAGSKLFAFSKTNATYDLSALNQVIFNDGVESHTITRLDLVAKEGPMKKWSQTWTAASLLRGLRRARSAGTVGADGAVTSTLNFSEINFAAPSGKFDVAALQSMTLAQAIQSIATTLSSAPLAEWNKFATWLGTTRKDFINEILRSFDYAAIDDREISIPYIEDEFDDFTDFAEWTITLLGTKGNERAANFWDSTDAAFKIPLHLMYRGQPELHLKESAAFTPTGYDRLTGEGVYAGYNGREYTCRQEDSDGLLDHNILWFTPDFCPTFDTNYGSASQYASAGYDRIIYVFTPTIDTQGILPQAIPQGWYAINHTTYAMTPFDLTNNPLKMEKTNLIGGATFIHPKFFEMFDEVYTSGVCWYQFAHYPTLDDVTSSVRTRGGTFAAKTSQSGIDVKFFAGGTHIGAQGSHYDDFAPYETLVAMGYTEEAAKWHPTHETSDVLRVASLNLFPYVNAAHGDTYRWMVYAPQNVNILDEEDNTLSTITAGYYLAKGDPKDIIDNYEDADRLSEVNRGWLDFSTGKFDQIDLNLYWGVGWADLNQYFDTVMPQTTSFDVNIIFDL